MNADAQTAPVTPITEADVDDVWEFFRRIPDGDRTFFKEQVVGPQTITGWLEGSGERLIARVDGAVAGYAAVIPEVGWSSHVGELRLVVDPGVRRRGLGSLLARNALVSAIRQDLSKVVVEVMADQQSTISLFTGLGFTAEALLEDHVRDHDGRLNDLIVLAHKVSDNWQLMSVVGLDQPLD